jgi:hypothetical protein
MDFCNCKDALAWFNNNYGYDLPRAVFKQIFLPNGYVKTGNRYMEVYSSTRISNYMNDGLTESDAKLIKKYKTKK